MRHTLPAPSQFRGRLRAALLAFSALFLGALPARAFITVNLPGNSTYDGWAGLSATNYPGYPTIGTYTSLWPAPIVANQPGSDGGGLYDKVSGGGFPSNGTGSGPGIYNFMAVGNYRLYDTSPLAGLQTLVAQFDIDAGVGGTFISTPVFNYNGGSQSLNPDYSFALGGSEYAYQWNLTSLGAITSYEIRWSTTMHSFTHAIQANQGDTFVQVVPEPSTVAAVMGVAVLGVVFWRRRRFSAA